MLDRMDSGPHIAWRHARFSSVFLAVASVPAIAWLLAFWSLVLRARSVCGEWPHPARGTLLDHVDSSIDPTRLGVHADIVGFGLILVGYAIPLAFLCLVATAAFPRARPDARLALVFSASAALVVATVIGNLGDFFLWFVD